MALIKCKDCGKKISAQAQTCPNCGCPDPKFTDNSFSRIRKAFGITDLLFGCFFICAVLTSESGMRGNPGPFTMGSLLLLTGIFGILSVHRRDFTIGSIVMYAISTVTSFFLLLQTPGFIIICVLQLIFLVLVCVSLSDKKSYN